MPKWTPTTLATQLIGELNVARNAAGGSVPARLANIVQEAYEDLWMCEEWRFRRRRSTFATVAGTQTVALTALADFDKLDTRWVDDQDSTTDERIVFTEDVEVFMQHEKDHAGQSGDPGVALIEPTDDSGYTHLIRLAPTPTSAVTLDLVYLCTPPTLGASATPLWPYRFHTGWHKLAKAKALEEFRRNKAYQDTLAIFEAWKTNELDRHNEYIRNSTVAIEDGNNDIPALTSQGGSDCVRLEPDG